MLSYNVLFCISKSFGCMVVIMTPIAKLPTIVKVICAKSGEGISKIGTLMEITGYAIFTSFAFSMKYSFSTWGEGLISCIELAFVHFLIWFYEKRIIALIFLLFFMLSMIVLMCGIIPSKVHSILFLYFFNSLILFGKLTQVCVNYRNGHTGNLSPLTYYLSLYRTIIRIFTSIIQTKDWRMILSFCIISIVNSILILQFNIYANSTEKFLRSQKRNKLNEEQK